jgi:signal recognition particle subunit SRP54
MGDIVSLAQKAQEVFDEKETAEMQKKMAKAEFSFNDFLKMQKQMKAFGSMGNLLSMIPGLNIGKDARDQISHVGEAQFKKIEVFISSMTPQERENPQLMNPSRKKRIAAGSGIAIGEINQFVSQFEQMRLMMKSMSNVQKGGKMDMNAMRQMMSQGGVKPKAQASESVKMKRKFK